MLGSALLRELEVRSTPYAAPSRSELDLASDGVGAALAGLRPQAVVNATAYTDVAGAERASERDAVDRLNRDAPGLLAEACSRLGVPLVHVSTDYVFDGRKQAPYVEDDPVAPLQVYGQSKLEGEKLVLAAHRDAVVARTSTLYGAGRNRRPHYVGAILRQARAQSRLEVVRLPVSNPTYSGDLARGLLDLLEADGRGIVHVVNDEGCSRMELALEVVRLAGLGESTEVLEREAVPGPPERPVYSVLDVSRFCEITGRPMRPWREGLAEYLAAESDGLSRT